MRPHTLTKMMFDCRCGQSHPQVTRLAGIPVLECPAMPDDALRLHIGPTGNVSLMMGESSAERAVLWTTVNEIAEKLAGAIGRLEALEAKMKRGAKE